MSGGILLCDIVSIMLVPVYQLGVSSVVLTGEILMSAGLPGWSSLFISYSYNFWK